MCSVAVLLSPCLGPRTSTATSPVPAGGGGAHSVGARLGANRVGRPGVNLGTHSVGSRLERLTGGGAKTFAELAADDPFVLWRSGPRGGVVARGSPAGPARWEADPNRHAEGTGSGGQPCAQRLQPQKARSPPIGKRRVRSGHLCEGVDPRRGGNITWADTP
jgi:hypothetical protein